MRLSDQSISEGDTLLLECCLVSRQPKAKVTWFLDSESITASEGQRMEFNGETARLISWNAFEGDCGRYRCVVETEGGKCETSAQVGLKKG